MKRGYISIDEKSDYVMYKHHWSALMQYKHGDILLCTGWYTLGVF